MSFSFIFISNYFWEIHMKKNEHSLSSLPTPHRSSPSYLLNFRLRVISFALPMFGIIETHASRGSIDMILPGGQREVSG